MAQQFCQWIKPLYSCRQYSMVSTAYSWWKRPHILPSYLFPPITKGNRNHNLTQQSPLFHEDFLWDATLRRQFSLPPNIILGGILMVHTYLIITKQKNTRVIVGNFCLSFLNLHSLPSTNMKTGKVYLLNHFIIDSSKQEIYMGTNLFPCYDSTYQ